MPHDSQEREVSPVRRHRKAPKKWIKEVTKNPPLLICVLGWNSSTEHWTTNESHIFVDNNREFFFKQNREEDVFYRKKNISYRNLSFLLYLNIKKKVFDYSFQPTIT